MISDQAVQIMEEYADDAAKMLAMFREMGREHGELEEFESSWRSLIEVARLLNADFRLRDALAEARWRADADGKSCHECAEPARVFQEDRWLCVPCYDAANAVNLVPVEPDAHALMVEAILNDPSGVGGEDEPDLAAADRAEDEYIAYTGTDAFLAEMVAEQREPDLAPSDAQDAEAAEVEIL